MKRNLGCQIAFAIVVGLLVVLLVPAFIVAFFFPSPSDPQSVLHNARVHADAGARAAGEYIKAHQQLPETLENLTLEKLNEHSMLTSSTSYQHLHLRRVSKYGLEVQYHDPALEPKQRERVAGKTAHKVEIFPGTETLYTIRGR